jgi:para-aminobenzoate synthetase component 1
MGAEPRWQFTVHGRNWTYREHTGQSQHGTGGALERIDELLDAQTSTPASECNHLPFHGGAVGWLAYDLGRQFESIDGTSVDDLGTADLRLAWYDAAVVWDHHDDKTWLVGIDGERDARVAVEELAGWLALPVAATTTPIPPPATARSDLSRADYMGRVNQVREGIARGEFYQLNLVQRFTCPARAPAQAIYLRLRQSNPAPFAAFLETDGQYVLSSSPERFLEMTPERRLRTWPIKGTRPRGTTPAEDAALRRELLESPKERAELLMIVDLLRNDFGRVCAPGTVEVTRLHAVESYATVHHLVGEVHGQLRPEITRRELLRAVFPGGSITGAPKVSAMRAIDRLEPHRRGLGMGAIGYFSAHGRIDLSIAIRTMVIDRDHAYVPVGAGIVWDSDPAAEYEETLVKAQALFAALGVTPEES